MTRSTKADKWVVYCSGCVFLIALLLIAIFIPEPTASQQTTFRIVLAIAAGAFGIGLPGLLHVEAKINSPWFSWVIRATGASAFFIVVYFWNPASMNEPSVPSAIEQPEPQDD